MTTNPIIPITFSPDAALLNFRTHQFHFVPFKNKVHIYADPPAANLKIQNRLRLTKGTCRGKHHRIHFNVQRQGATTTVSFKGDYPGRCGNHELSRVVLSNDDYVFGVFKSLWEGMGGKINGGIGKTSINGQEPFYVIPSRPLSDIITLINKYSNNVMARQLLLSLGREKLGGVGSKETGRQAIADWLEDIGISAPELIIDNGSGLSRHSKISAYTLAMLLQHAVGSAYQPEFFASLPLVGVDGTVEERLKGKLPPGNARIKTGLINNVRTMAGYVKNKAGKDYIIVFSAKSSGHSVSSWYACAGRNIKMVIHTVTAERQ